MSDVLTITLAAIFLAAIPINVYVDREVRKLASPAPRIGILSLLSQIVDLLAFVAVILGVVSFTSVVFLLTGVRILVAPIPTAALIVVLVTVSFANVLVWRYLRRTRAKGAA